jgi:hypothetical protein
MDTVINPPTQLQAATAANPPAVSNNNAKTPSAWATPAILLLAVFMVAAGWWAPPAMSFVLIVFLMLSVMLVLGLAITKKALGVLINERNVMSLSRFQMALWTIIILAAYFTFACVRIHAWKMGALNNHQVITDPVKAKQPLPDGAFVIVDPLDIGMDWHLFALLGISTTTLIGTPLILSTKKDDKPDPSAAQKVAPLIGERPEDIEKNKQGVLYANSTINDARLTDMFQGDELINTAQIDLAKVQMFYFTVIAALCFVVLVFQQLVQANTNLSSLPVLPDGLVALLGISHAGYLTSKTVTHTNTQP